MNDSALLEPWEQAQQAQTPLQAPPPTMEPWEAAQQAQVAQSTPTGYPEPQIKGNDATGDSVPPEQKAMNALQTVGQGMGVGSLAGMGGVAASKMFENVPDLLDAGIKPKTLQMMTPQGVTSTDYAKTLQDQLNSEGLIGKTSKDTLTNFIDDTKQAGTDVGTARDAIAQAQGPQAVTVNAQSALQPIYDAWSKAVNAFVPDSKIISTFGKYYTALMKTAQDQGGQLTLDNIHDFLQEIGPKVHAGSEANQAIFSDLYKAGIDAQNGAVNTVASNAGDASLGKNLLDANARFTRNLRLMPDVAMNDAKSAIKEGISAFQKYGGPTILKYGASGATALTGEKLLERLYHTITGGGE